MCQKKTKTDKTGVQENNIKIIISDIFEGKQVATDDIYKVSNLHQYLYCYKGSNEL